MLFRLTVTVQLRALALYGAPRAGHALAPRSPVRPPTVTHVLRGRARLFPPARCVGSAHIAIRGPSSGPRLLVAPPCLLAEPPYPHCAAPPAGYTATPSLCPPSRPSYRPSYRPVCSSRRALDAGCPYRRCSHLLSLRSGPHGHAFRNATARYPTLCVPVTHPRHAPPCSLVALSPAPCIGRTTSESKAPPFTASGTDRGIERMTAPPLFPLFSS
ncbi:hypothetical protein B0H11DRAFT_2240845 [Mycena galericulata]|nr:hypothetical protein B0H11DRAFT_2240845 [Mycena galericulata]